ncbi:WD40/YVTN/BNR-like repeat-containing protein [Synoicihabitans lomoniglobus]|uniref:Ig-like domain-containing protein n=1 Tax=Synoicihabitans lomoniglobus TaxID=2909285 RepID=A0AAF0I868_9BACT|nr:hypothetical protein [Opitutaceae bacterium LMO-M01]WED67396.1 hypothetical protein PXH66_11105 [Opitutaceae bacterium LMO-M01]
MTASPRFRMLAFLASLLLPVLVLPGQSSWQRHWPLVTRPGLNDIATDGEKFVAVGAVGTVLTSTDGLTWQAEDAGTWESLQSIAYRGGQFIANGSEGTLFSSPDGLEWHQRLGGGRADQSHPAFGNGVYVTSGLWQQRYVLRSTDGATWEQVSMSFDPGSIVFGTGHFYANAAEVPGVRQSTDGRNWQLTVIDGATHTPDTFALPVSGNGVTLMASFRPDNSIAAYYRTTDGENWALLESNHALEYVYFSDGWFWSREAGTAQVLRSSDGSIWEPRPEADYGNRQLARIGDIRVWVGPGAIHRSVGEADWEPTTRPYGAQADERITTHALTHHDGRWVHAQGLTSTDAENWEPITFTNNSSDNGNEIKSASHAGNAFYLTKPSIHQDARVYRSEDGQIFSPVADLPGLIQAEVVYANGTYLIVGTETRDLHRSLDGINWITLAQNQPASSLSDASNGSWARPGKRLLTTDGTTFFLFVESGGLFTSADGTTWTPVSEKIANQSRLNVLRYADGWLLAGSDDGVHTSSDGGSTWTTWPPPLRHIQSVDHVDGRIIAMGHDRHNYGLVFMATSSDNVVWSRSAYATTGDIRGLVSVAGRTFATMGGNTWVSRAGQGPQITATPPAEAVIFAGLSPDLTVAATGTSPLSYQWARYGIDIEGATAATLTTPLESSEGRHLPLTVKISDGAHTTSVYSLLRVAANEAPEARHETGIATARIKDANGPVAYRLYADFSGEELTFTWYRDGVLMPDESEYSLSVPINAFTIGHHYRVTATNLAGSATSEDYPIEVPAITLGNWIEDRDQDTGALIRLGIENTHAGRYQWRRNGVPIPDATLPWVNLQQRYGPDELSLSSGFYDVLLFNSFGTVRSETYRYQRPEDAPLPTATPQYPFAPLTPPRLVNLSVRGITGAGEATLIPGFVFDRDTILTTDTPYSFIVRAVGPGLTGFGIADAISDPTLALIDASGTTLAHNEKWADNPTDLTATFDHVGAFALANDSHDAALLHELTAAPGAVVLTAPVVDSSDATGETLVELYELPDGNGTRLTNLSTRGLVTPDRPLTAGFVISGDGSLSLLLRAVGPALEDFGVQLPAPDPRLAVFNAAGDLIAGSVVPYPHFPSDLENTIGAFPIVPDSRNAGLLVTLPPGAYTVQALDDFGGIVLLEVYPYANVYESVEIPDLDEMIPLSNQPDPSL